MEELMFGSGFAATLVAIIAWMMSRRDTRQTDAPARENTAASGDPQPKALGGGCIALLDLDDLAGVNSAADYDTGDHLLNAVGDVLKRAIPQDVIIDRLDGGRFLLSLPGHDLASGSRTVERLRGLASAANVDGPNGRVTRTLSAGVVPTFDDESRARAILRADSALAAAKRLGGARTETELGRSARSLAPLRSEIEEAVATRALEYHVQPIIRLSDMKPAGMEALLRWNRTDGSVAGPSEFVEALDRIPEVGADLLPDVAVDAATPFVTGPDPLFMTFNITGAVLDGIGSPGCTWLRHLLDRLPTDALVLEIVENAVLVNPERADDLMARLRAKGVRFALDDFGSGLSNLERLRRFPAEFLKIDRIFVEGLGGEGREETILQGLVAMAGGLGLEIIAEGIETEAQAQIVRDLGVTYGQGYHLGRPAPAAVWAERIGRGPTSGGS